MDQYILLARARFLISLGRSNDASCLQSELLQANICCTEFEPGVGLFSKEQKYELREKDSKWEEIFLRGFRLVEPGDTTRLK